MIFMLIQSGQKHIPVHEMRRPYSLVLEAVHRCHMLTCNKLHIKYFPEDEFQNSDIFLRSCALTF